MLGETVNIYIRNSQKYGKILTVASSLTSDDLYRQAASTQNLQQDQFHLYYGGKLIPRGDAALSLKEKAIIHLVAIKETSKDQIEVNVRMLEGRTHPTIIKISSSSTIRQFIDQKLLKVYGQKSDKLVLIHIGRQLNLDKTFQEEEIEDGSQLFCVDIEELKEKQKQSPHEKQGHESEEEPNDIYPTPNFPIEVPQQVNATNKMDLLFDPNIRHTSSIPDYDLPPQEVIPEEDSKISAIKANLTSVSSEKEKIAYDENEASSEKVEQDPKVEDLSEETANMPQQPEANFHKSKQNEAESAPQEQSQQTVVPAQGTQPQGEQIENKDEPNMKSEEQFSPIQNQFTHPDIEKCPEEERKNNVEAKIQLGTQQSEQKKEEGRKQDENAQLI